MVFVSVSKCPHLFQFGFRGRILKVKIISCFIVLCMKQLAFQIYSNAAPWTINPSMACENVEAGLHFPAYSMSLSERERRVGQKVFGALSLWTLLLRFLSWYDPRVTIRNFGFFLPLSLVSWGAFGPCLGPTEQLGTWPYGLHFPARPEAVGWLPGLWCRKINFPACFGRPPRKPWQWSILNDLGVEDSISHGALVFPTT